VSSAPLLDDRTAATIRDALRAARSGRIDEACRIGEEGLASGGDTVALNAMLGTLHCHNGDLAAGIRYLRAAHEIRPDDPVIASNLATALIQTGEYRDAFDVIPETLARSDRSMGLERLRGFLAQNLGDFPTAIASYERVVGTVPDDWESWNNLGNARRFAGDFAAGIAALRHAVELNPRSAPVRLNLATALTYAGKLEESEDTLRKMAKDFPDDPLSLKELHALLNEQGREVEALEAIQAASSRDPDNIELLLGLASHQLSVSDAADAEATYREVIRREPGHGLGNLGLAVAFELTNRTQELSDLIGEAEKRGAGAEILHFIRAFDHRRSHRFAEGLAEMKQVPQDLETARRYQLLGQLSDGAGKYDEAFAAFARMNEIQSAHPSRPLERAAAYREQLRAQIGMLGPRFADSWREGDQPDGRLSPVFLVGFPRSGTTLLDTMLMGHPGVEVLEEEPTLSRAAEHLPEFNAIPEASDSQIRNARDEYFRTASAKTPLQPGRLLVDKNPLSMNAVPVIRRLFRDARIILAVRHPADVVLSCFTSNFKLNAGMSSFLRLETAAELYDLSFRNFEAALALFSLPVHRVIYENVVADPEAELRSLLDFLGLEWSDQVLEHEATARSRGRIKTASYAQVGEPIYRRSAGRWKHYRKHLEPVLPLLEPWAAKFGYSV
jgi:tetratricopeptide (TPR) repeat protein